MGERPIRDDFEGIAIVDERFYLVTSDGGIYESREGEDDERMLFNFYGTGVGRRCEVEGLAFEPSDRSLLLLCKSPRDDSLEDVVAWRALGGSVCRPCRGWLFSACGPGAHAPGFSMCRSYGAFGLWGFGVWLLPGLAAFGGWSWGLRPRLFDGSLLRSFWALGVRCVAPAGAFGAGRLRVRPFGGLLLGSQ